MTTYTYAELQTMRRTEELAVHRKFDPTSEELRAALGEGWAICRATPNNVARYRNCVSRGRYEKAVAEIISARLDAAERLQPQSADTIRQLVKLHGADAVVAFANSCR